MNLFKTKSIANYNSLLITAISIVLLIYRLLFFNSNSFNFFLINDILVLVIITVLTLYVIKIISTKKPNPLELVINTGIITAFIFLLILFSEQILNLYFEDVRNKLTDPSFFESIVFSLFGILILVTACYWFASFNEFYFNKRRENNYSLYVIMIVFISLSSVSNLLFNESEHDYILDTFFILAVVFIALNSVKITWIAFVSKKEKIALLFLSVIITVLFILNLLNSSESTFTNLVLRNFSPTLQQFFSLILLYGSIYFSVLFFTTLFHIPTAEVYDRKANEVSSLQYFSKLITQVLDFEDLADTITEIATKVSSADAAWIVTKEKSEHKIISKRNIAFLDADLINTFIFNNGICDNLSETKIFSLEKFINKKKLSDRISSIAISPLRNYNEIKGYLITARKNDLLFYEEDKSAINTFSDYASVALENSLLLEQSIEKERLEKELDVAREIQKKILPANDPKFANLSITSAFIPAFEVGGDYYDYFEISENKFGFVIADVSGKGISAAFIMAEVKGIFSSLSKLMESPREILIKANEILGDTLNKKNFVSALYGVVDFNKELIQFARAGHCPAILLKENSLKEFKPSGIGLGLADNSVFLKNIEEISIRLEDNNLFVFYTDGITDAKNNNQEDFGEKRFNELLVKNSDKNINDLAGEVIKNVTLFSKNHTQYDDITLVILKWHKKINLDGV